MEAKTGIRKNNGSTSKDIWSCWRIFLILRQRRKNETTEWNGSSSDCKVPSSHQTYNIHDKSNRIRPWLHNTSNKYIGYNSISYVDNWNNKCQEEEAHHHQLSSIQPTTIKRKSKERVHSMVAQKECQRQWSFAKIATIRVDFVAMMLHAKSRTIQIKSQFQLVNDHL